MCGVDSLVEGLRDIGLVWHLAAALRDNRVKMLDKQALMEQLVAE